MARRVRVQMNSRGSRALLRSGAVAADLQRRVDAIAARAGEGMESSVHIGSNRARGSVITGTAAARRREAINKDLTRSLDAGR